MSDTIEIQDYDPRWPGLFEEEKRRLEHALSDGNVAAIEHIGGTAVPGLAAEPVVDMLVMVRWFAQARSEYPALLAPLQYVRGDDGLQPGSSMFFVKGMPPQGGRRTHHVHIVQYDNGEFTGMLRFRDYLRNHALVAENYGRLKRRLAEQYSENRYAYAYAKSGFIHTVMTHIHTRGV